MNQCNHKDTSNIIKINIYPFRCESHAAAFAHLEQFRSILSCSLWLLLSYRQISVNSRRFSLMTVGSQITARREFDKCHRNEEGHRLHFEEGGNCIFEKKLFFTLHVSISSNPLIQHETFAQSILIHL